MKKTILASIALSALIVAGCGTNTPNPTTTPTQGSNQTTSQATNQTSSDSGSSTQQTALKQQEIDLTVLPGAHLGPDGKLHDTFSPADFSVVQGVPVKLTVYNFDGGTHTLTNSALGLNLQVKGHVSNGVPSVNTVTFTPTKAGTFTWQCMDPCDGQNGGWAMSHDGYMQGKITVVPQSTNQQFVTLTIKDGVRFAKADGKLHDSFSPADFTVQKGIPVTVTVENYDSGEHSLTSTSLGINQVFKGASKTTGPSVTTFTFTPTKAGDFNWQCEFQCDGGMTSYSMTHPGYMMGTIHVVD